MSFSDTKELLGSWKDSRFVGKTAVNNPFREDLVSRNLAEACSVVIFGATGDLTHRKLIPALYNLAIDGELPAGVKILGFARRDWSDEFFVRGLKN